MNVKQALKTDSFQEVDARTPERKNLNLILDKDRQSETLFIT